MEKTIVKAYMNHGRWLWRCPDCGSVNFVEKDVCAADFPGTLAKALQIKPGHENKPRPLFIPVADLEERKAARQEAKTAGKVRNIVLPKEQAAIEKLLRPRDVVNMNWYPGESVDDLLAENKTHGVQA